MTEVVLEEVDIYVLLLHNTVSQYIATQTMLELYLVAERRPGVLLIWRWWDQAGINFLLEAMRETECTGDLEAEGYRDEDAEMAEVGRQVAAE